MGGWNWPALTFAMCSAALLPYFCCHRSPSTVLSCFPLPLPSSSCACDVRGMSSICVSVCDTQTPIDTPCVPCVCATRVRVVPSVSELRELSFSALGASIHVHAYSVFCSRCDSEIHEGERNRRVDGHRLASATTRHTAPLVHSPRADDPASAARTALLQGGRRAS
jgi:hypothetical protein